MRTLVSASTNVGPQGTPRPMVGDDRGEEVPEEELHQQRGAAEEPDVGPAEPGQDRVGGHPQDGEDDTADDADRHGEGGQQQRGPQPLHDHRREEELADGPPLHPGIGDPALQEEDQQEGHDDRGDALARAPYGDGAQGFRGGAGAGAAGVRPGEGLGHAAPPFTVACFSAPDMSFHCLRIFA